MNNNRPEDQVYVPNVTKIVERLSEKFVYKVPSLPTTLDEVVSPDKNLLVEPEVLPTKNSHPAIPDLVLEDMKARDQFGKNKYGTRLQPFNGRDPNIDLYQELLDAVQYCRQIIYERRFEQKVIDAAIRMFVKGTAYQSDFDILNDAVGELLDARKAIRDVPSK